MRRISRSRKNILADVLRSKGQVAQSKYSDYKTMYELGDFKFQHLLNHKWWEQLPRHTVHTIALLASGTTWSKIGSKL